MLDRVVIKKIEDFVYLKPRSVQDIARHIKRNWRTADRYIDYISSEYGTISTTVFRKGTRGALKIVYWSSVEKASKNVFQENLEKELLLMKKKEDFSGFDIFQLVKDENKRAIVENAIDENSTNLSELKELLESAKKEVLLFSGNLSFINLNNKNFNMLGILEELVKRDISIKVVCRADFTARKNLESLLSLNFKYGKELVEIRHLEQPLRAVLVDRKLLRIKEVKEPTGKINELDKKVFIFYTIKDKEWGEWASKIFWKMFSFSISAKLRLEEMKKLKIKS